MAGRRARTASMGRREPGSGGFGESFTEQDIFVWDLEG